MGIWIAAVIVHYHGGAAITACVRSLLASSRVPDRIVVIDNGSEPGWDVAFQRDFPGVLVVRSPRNLGFAGALPAAVADYAIGGGTPEDFTKFMNTEADRLRGLIKSGAVDVE